MPYIKLPVAESFLLKNRWEKSWENKQKNKCNILILYIVSPLAH